MAAKEARANIVLVFMVFMGVVIGLLDTGASKLVTAVSSLNNTATEDTTAADSEVIDEEVTESVESETVTDEAAETETAADGN